MTTSCRQVWEGGQGADMGDDEERSGPADEAEAPQNFDCPTSTWGKQRLSCLCHWTCFCQPGKCSRQSGNRSIFSSLKSHACSLGPAAESCTWTAALAQDVWHRDQIRASPDLRRPCFPSRQCKDAPQKHLPGIDNDQRVWGLEDLWVWVLPYKLCWARARTILVLPRVWPWPATRNLSSGGCYDQKFHSDGI